MYIWLGMLFQYHLTKFKHSTLYRSSNTDLSWLNLAVFFSPSSSSKAHLVSSKAFFFFFWQMQNHLANLWCLNIQKKKNTHTLMIATHLIFEYRKTNNWRKTYWKCLRLTNDGNISVRALVFDIWKMQQSNIHTAVICRLTHTQKMQATSFRSLSLRKCVYIW